MRVAIETPSAPKAIGPYSQAIRAGNMVFVSGQIPIDPATGELVRGSIEDETDRVMKNLAAILEAAGTHFAQVARATIYLTDLGHFAAVNGVYARYFSGDPPARATVEVSRLPKDARVEIDLVAVL